LRAVVVGAGIGGLSAAIALRNAGADVTVHEKMPELHEVGSGLTLWVNAMRALEKMGVDEAVRERGAVLEAIENYRADGTQFKTLPIAQVAAKRGAPSVSIHRAILQQTLAEALPDGALRLGSECTGVEQDGDGVRLSFADGGEERADLVVAADGIRTTIGNQVFGELPLRYSGYTCWRSAVQADHPELDPKNYLQFYGTRSTFGIFAIGNGTWSWYGTRFTEQGGGDGGNGAQWKEEAQQAFEGWPEAVRAVIGETPEKVFVRQDICDRVPIESWVSGRVALLGDAAHPTTPTLGQGGCQAIESALVLGRVISEEPDVPAALRRYESERKERANGIVRQAWRHGKMYHGVNPALRVARDTVILRGPVRIAMREVDKLMGYEA
jgi:2-polyprenyl-6-methoxyphenol hydroxylase-like FAD-dependent oxidoreductase